MVGESRGGHGTRLAPGGVCRARGEALAAEGRSGACEATVVCAEVVEHLREDRDGPLGIELGRGGR
jgi:hypothetical protein